MFFTSILYAKNKMPALLKLMPKKPPISVCTNDADMRSAVCAPMKARAGYLLKREPAYYVVGTVNGKKFMKPNRAVRAALRPPPEISLLCVTGFESFDILHRSYKRLQLWLNDNF